MILARAAGQARDEGDKKLSEKLVKLADEFEEAAKMTDKGAEAFRAAIAEGKMPPKK